MSVIGVIMAKKELDFLDKYCKTKKIERESYEPFCDLIVKLHQMQILLI